MIGSPDDRTGVGVEREPGTARDTTRRIHILPDQVANQIAAGEVVERPASVVKELIENALDAEARRIEISVRNGGKTELRVADDGTGMSRADALLALDRHATSKIRHAEDLQKISSFGFRGEALPSIAAVSRLELLTATSEGEATRIRVTAGAVHGVEDGARRPGTTVTVRSLFQNVPARAKFLRSTAVETRAISETVVVLALSNLHVHFRLESNGRELLELPATEDLVDRVAEIWDAELANSLIDLDYSERGGVGVSGLIERPDAARPGGWRRYLFVNGRPFRDARLSRAVDEGYRTTVPSEVRPTAFLYFQLPPEFIDVNVHPAKTEVRFRDQQLVERTVVEGLIQRLGRTSSAAPLDRGGSRREERSGTRPVERGEGRREERGEGQREERGGNEEGHAAGQLAFFVRSEPEPDGEYAGEPPAVERPELWQLHATYLLASTRQGLLIIDQHSAHERVLFEEIVRAFTSEEAPSQRLLFPITARLSPSEYSVVEELQGLFQRVGFDVEPFGDRTVIVRSSPNLHAKFDPERCFRDMVQELTHGSPLVDAARTQHERIAKSLACKGAIKAGTPLSNDEMTELFDRLFATDLPGHDVHGRPTVVSLTMEELGKRFGRS